MDKKFICTMPFSNIDIESDGTAKPCCIYGESIGNINDSSLTELWNNNRLHNIRQNMLNGNKDPMCGECWKEEQSTGTSKRLRELKDVPHDVFVNPKMHKIDIKLGNTCNLKCRICNPVSSSLFNSENKLLVKHGSNVNYINNSQIDQYKWHTSEVFWDNLLEFKDEIQQIDMLGGEPLLEKNQEMILQRLIDIGTAKNVIINYTTNGTIKPNFNLLTHFKKVYFTVSADGIADRFEYCRFPGNWDQVAENINYISKNADSCLISYSVSNFSLFGIPDALDYYSKHDIHVWFNFVHYPEIFSVNNLPPLIKQRFNNMLTTRRTEDWNKCNSDIDALLGFVNQNGDYSLFDKFIYECKLRDKIRNQNYRKYMPEFSGYE